MNQRRVKIEGQAYVAVDDGVNRSCRGCAFEVVQGPSDSTGCTLLDREDELFFETINSCTSSHGPRSQVFWVKEE